MGSWRAALSSSSRYTRAGLTKGSGWDALAVASFFESDPPNEAHNTLADLTTAASGSSVVGSSAETLDALVSAGTGAHGVSGSAGNTLATVVSAAAGGSTHGTSAVTLATVVSAATGGSTHGTSAVTLATVVSAGAGTSAGGSSAETLAALTTSGAGLVVTFGAPANTLDAVVSAAAGTSTPDWTIDFEDGTVPAALYWIGPPGTAVDRADAAGGTLKALQFPDISDGEESYFELWAQASGGDLLLIRYEVSSEENYDNLHIYIDGAEVVEASGVGAGWQEYSTTLSAGLYAIKFSYSKDSSADDGDDTAWISGVFYPPGIKPSLGAATLEDLTTAAVGATDEPLADHYRYWRVHIEAANGRYGSVDLWELELRGELGGADLTDTLPGIPRSTNQFYSGEDAEKVFDNNTTTFDGLWTCDLAFTGTIDFEFTTYPQQIKQVLVNATTQTGPLNFYVTASLLGDYYFEYKGIFYGETEWDTSLANPNPRTFDLVGGNRRFDGKAGYALARSSYQDFCDADHISVMKITLATLAGVYKLVTNSTVQMPYNPSPLPVTHNDFHIRGVIYADDGVGGKPGTLIATTSERTETAGLLPYQQGNWFSLEFTDPVFLRPGSYYIGVMVGGDQDMQSCETQNTGTSYTVASSYGAGAPAIFPSGETPSTPIFPVFAVYPVSTSFETLGSLTSNAFGIVGDLEPITGTAVDLLDDLVCAGAGSFVLPITGTAAALLESLSSAGFGARGVLRPRQTLNGSYRPVISLNATWVPR